MRRLLLPSTLAFTALACGNPPAPSDGGTDAGTDAGLDAGSDAGADAGCDCGGMCTPDLCSPFDDGDGGVICECAV